MRSLAELNSNCVCADGTLRETAVHGITATLPRITSTRRSDNFSLYGSSTEHQHTYVLMVPIKVKVQVKVKADIALHGNPILELYGTSLAIWDHTVF